MARRRRLTQRHQPRIEGGRIPRHAGLDQRINHAVQHTMQKFNCSAAFVVSTALADFFGIELDQRCDKVEREKPARVLQMRKRA